MEVNDLGRRFITQEEGQLLHTYRCAANVLTIGVGHTGKDVLPGMKITEQQSQQLLTNDLHRFELAVSHLVTKKLTQNQFNALVSFAFNCGAAALEKSSLLVAINRGITDRAELVRRWCLWCKIKGATSLDLLARRRREVNLFCMP